MTDQSRPDQPAKPQPNTNPSNDTPDKGKNQPTKKLPTNRINFKKQLDVIRAYGISSQAGTRAVSVQEVAALVDMVSTTVGLMNTFLVENGFVERIGNDMQVSKPVIDFAQAYNWSPDTASYKLAPLIKRTWFGERLIASVSYRQQSVDAAIADLAGIAGASRDYRIQIENLVDYVVASGLVKREGNQLSLGEDSAMQTPPPQTERANPMPDPRDVRDDPLPKSQAAVSTGFMTTEGAVQFHVAIRVSMQEMSGWSPDRITAFFSGLAQVLAAKKGTEEV